MRVNVSRNEHGETTCPFCLEPATAATAETTDPPGEFDYAVPHVKTCRACLARVHASCMKEAENRCPACGQVQGTRRRMREVTPPSYNSEGSALQGELVMAALVLILMALIGMVGTVVGAWS